MSHLIEDCQFLLVKVVRSFVSCRNTLLLLSIFMCRLFDRDSLILLFNTILINRGLFVEQLSILYRLTAVLPGSSLNRCIDLRSILFYQRSYVTVDTRQGPVFVILTQLGLRLCGAVDLATNKFLLDKAYALLWTYTGPFERRLSILKLLLLQPVDKVFMLVLGHGIRNQQ